MLGCHCRPQSCRSIWSQKPSRLGAHLYAAGPATRLLLAWGCIAGISLPALLTVGPVNSASIVVFTSKLSLARHIFGKRDALPQILSIVPVNSLDEKSAFFRVFASLRKSAIFAISRGEISESPMQSKRGNFARYFCERDALPTELYPHFIVGEPVT
jgi:hypothetical protein